MKRLSRNRLILGASMLVIVVALFVFSSTANAQVVSWGGIVSGMPSCVSRDLLLSEELVCVTRGTDNDLYSIQINPRTGATVGLRTLGYTRSLVGNPSCTATSAPYIACAIRGQFNELYGILFDPVTMQNSGLQRLDKSGDFRTLAGDPSCVNSGPTSDTFKGGLTVATCGVRGSDNRLHFAVFSGSTQGISQSSMVRAEADVVIVGDPSCALGWGDQVVCVARSTNSSLAIIDWQRNASRTNYSYLAGPTPFALGNPSCASTGLHSQFLAAGFSYFSTTGMVTCGVRGTDSALYLIRFGLDGSTLLTSRGSDKAFGTGLLAYQSLGGIITNDPSCATTRSREVTCGVRGTDGYLYLIDADTRTTSRSTYQRQPMIIPGDARCVTFSADQEDWIGAILGTTPPQPSERNIACAVLDLQNGLVTVTSVRPPIF